MSVEQECKPRDQESGEGKALHTCSESTCSATVDACAETECSLEALALPSWQNPASLQCVCLTHTHLKGNRHHRMQTIEVPCPPGARLHFSWHFTNNLYVLPVAGSAGRTSTDELLCASVVSWCVFKCNIAYLMLWMEPTSLLCNGIRAGSKLPATQ